MLVNALPDNFHEDEYGILRSDKTVALSYPSTGNDVCFSLEDTSFWFRHRNNCILEAVRRFPPEGEILDIGGGNGYVTKRLLDEGFPAILLEPGLSGAYNGKVGRRLPRVVCATLEDLALPDASVAAVGCFDVIEHIEDDAAFVSEIARILQPGGLFYLTLPAKQWLWSACDVYSGHFRRHDENTVAELLGGKFDIPYFTFFFGCLTLPIFLLKSAPFRLGLVKEKPNVLANETEHGTDGGIAVSVIERLLKRETRMIREGRSKMLGTSCLVVGRRV